MIRKSSVALALVCALFFALAARAQEVTPAEKDKALALLESTKKDVLDATKGLSTAQWNFKSAPDRWSIAECMEHIAAAEDYIRGSVESGVMKAPAVPGRDVAAIDAGIIANVPERKAKFQAPEAIKPTGLDPRAVESLWQAFLDGAPGLYWSRVWAIYVFIRWCHRHQIYL